MLFRARNKDISLRSWIMDDYERLDEGFLREVKSRFSGKVILPFLIDQLVSIMWEEYVKRN